MMQTVTREQALAGTLALVNPAHPLQARPAPEALVPAMPDAPGVLLARQAAELDTGDCFCAEGRVQSRVYLKVTEGTTRQRTAYEVSVMHMAQREDFPPE